MQRYNQPIMANSLRQLSIPIRFFWLINCHSVKKLKDIISLNRNNVPFSTSTNWRDTQFAALTTTDLVDGIFKTYVQIVLLANDCSWELILLLMDVKCKSLNCSRFYLVFAVWMSWTERWHWFALCPDIEPFI